MFRNRSVSAHSFAMVPRADIPRSAFRMQQTLKTTFDSGYLVPIYCQEILPGDTFNVRMTAFCRLATPLFPFMDNLWLDTFFFFVPNRLTWSNWKRFMGEQPNPGDTISFVIPQLTAVGGFSPLTLADYFGLPTVGQVDPAGTISVNALPLRGYNLIYNEWFRDENLINAATVPTGDGPDAGATYPLRRRGKRHDYFTSCLPWPQKGNTAVSLPLGSTAPVVRDAAGLYWAEPGPRLREDGGAFPEGYVTTTVGANQPIKFQATATGNLFLDWSANAPGQGLGGTGLMTDLSAATAATINSLRQAFQIQRLLERDARGGTRYTEIVRAHFGVVSPDARLQRPEYLGGGTTPINLHPVAQTSATEAGSPQGDLAAFGTALAGGHGFTQSFTEHGYVIGLANVRADLTYQQGLHKMWSRSTRYDFYFPVFAHLGEQAVLRKEIYVRGIANDDNTVFGYQERWAEYRYGKSMITGLFRSTSAGNIDEWHLAQQFGSPPVLNQAFIEETPPLDRVLAVGAGANGQQLLMDAFFDARAARPMPTYSVPGMIDHF